MRARLKELLVGISRPLPENAYENENSNQQTTADQQRHEVPAAGAVRTVPAGDRNVTGQEQQRDRIPA